ncbi:hypothetical protein [Candidatus Mycoplasma haematominutum]|uniref:Uncharacterized protein n=1 Tax=Candidatus Mycoplasma haematominutum 'Birmingham 1' TaxID=1116213 RepID=G8C3J1_9MOLU|nr:hypothetical protein [Candidatus Mycoplasma haematominutum]CCE66889.1 hypothetical protein MHM_03710 [Candidatus Mycoplasma haematominutum 'Birmingham 1']
MSKQREIVASKLQEIKQDIDLSKEGVIDDNQSGMTVKNTFSEINREEKALEIQLEGKSKVEEALQQSKKYIGNYWSGKQKLEAYASKQSTSSSRRRKRSVEQNTSTILSKDERAALLEIYKIVEKLYKSRGALNPKLQTIAGEDAISLTLQSIPESKEFEKQLRQIDWTTQTEVKYTTVRPVGLGKKAKPDEWADWTKNPYSKFLESKDKFDELVNKLKTADSGLKTYLSRNRLNGLAALLRGPQAVRTAYSGRAQYDKQLGAARSDFANMVGLKLLIWMGQHGKQSLS